MKKRLILLTFMLLSLVGWSQALTDSIVLDHNQLLGLPSQNLTIVSPCLESWVENAKLQVWWDMGEDYDLGANQWTADVTVAVRGFDQSALPVFNYVCNLSTSEASPEALFERDLTPIFGSVSTIEVEVVGYNNGFTHSQLQARLRAGYIVDYGIKVKQLAGASGPNASLTPLNPVVQAAPSTFVHFSWQVNCPDIPNYQFQLLRLRNRAAGQASEYSIQAADDWSDALTIETDGDNPYVDVTITEGTGYYFWRVRPIGDFYPGGIADARNWGNWTTNVLPVGAVSQAALPSLFFYNQFEEDLNWMHGRVFAEQGRIKETFGYANGLGQARQNQVFLPSEGSTVLSQTEYDYAGRAAFSSLPVPDRDPGFYYRDALLKHGGNVYSQEDFDGDANWRNPLPLNAGLVADYYSPNNTDTRIPDAEGYAFTRTLFYGDGMSRPLESSGVGSTHRIKSTGDIHTTRVYYSGVTDAELVRVLGDEAPAASSVHKSITIDPNGQASIAYVDKSGQTIMTCLSGSKAIANPLVESLPSRKNEDAFEVIHKPIGREMMGANAFRTTTTFALSEQTPVTFSLQMTPNQLSMQCLNLCQSCDYKISLKLKRLDDRDNCPNCGTIYVNEIAGEDCAVSSTGINWNSIIILEPGTYYIERLVEGMQVDPTPSPGPTFFDNYRILVQNGLLSEADATLAQVNAFLQAEDLDGLNSFLLTQCPTLVNGESCQVNGACCGFDIPYNTCEGTSCVGLDWEQMLITRWSGTAYGGSGFGNFLPSTGYGHPDYGLSVPNAFNTLVQRMLLQEQLPPLGPGQAPYYDCEHLKTCWRGIVESYGMMKDLELTQPNFVYDPVEAFLRCAGYHIQGYDNSPASSTAPWVTHPYAFMHYAPGTSACETNLMPSGIASTWSTLSEEDRNAFFFCTQSISTTSNQTAQSLEAQMEADCIDACESRFYEYVETVKNFWREPLNGGYTIEGDPATNQPMMALSEVYCEAAAMVNYCKAHCDFTLGTNGLEAADGLKCLLTGQLLFRGAAQGPPGSKVCATGAPVNTTSTPVYKLLKYLNGAIGPVRDSHVATGNPTTWFWDYQVLAAGMFTSPPGWPQVGASVLVHPLEHSYFVTTSASCGLGCDNCNMDYIREGALVPDLGFLEPDGDYRTIGFVHTVPANGYAANTNIQLQFPGTWSIQPLAVSQLGGNNLTTAVVNTNTFTINSSTAIPGGSLLYFEATGGTSTTSIYTGWCPNGEGCEDICLDCVELDIPVGTVFEELSCESYYLQQVAIAIAAQRTQCLDDHLAELAADYQSTCIDGYTDVFEIKYDLHYYHYTLYGYDRAGNLVRTTPPHGVLPNATDRNSVTTHVFSTWYKYNSLGQLQEQNTPDGGHTAFWYDDLGRLRFSQNAQQVADASYSYTKYDYLGRSIEVGESNYATSTLSQEVNNRSFPSLGSSRVFTVYSRPANITNHLGRAQRFLENNVSHVYNDEGVYTFFSYDPHGNVDWMIQRVPGLGDKEIGYEYDLISGKVLRVKYQEGQSDQFYHRYTYDADNRLLAAETSLDGLIWDRDGRYDYYKHGPLERLVYGEDKVQGLDYVHTIQGWLKGLNHSSLDQNLDPSHDGQANNVGKDAWGMLLGYFEGDFKHGAGNPYNNESSNLWALNPGAATGAVGYDGLYNGNISTWSWRTADWHGGNHQSFEFNGEAKAYAFRYDELNRIYAARHQHMKISNSIPTQWQTSGSSYQADYRYDAAGNISTLRRDGITASTAMDDLTYYYDDGNGGTYSFDANTNTFSQALDPSATNRLNWVDDSKGAQSYVNDLGAQLPGNYTYNAIGELTNDLSEGLEISWNPYHKVSKVHKGLSTSGGVQDILFGYDAMQHRVSKKVTHVNIADYEKTYYIYDAQGNVMSIYTTERASDWVTTKQTEIPIYGADRLGLVRRDLVLAHHAVMDGEGDPTGEGGPPSAERSAGVITEPKPGHVRIVEVMHDSPLTEPRKEADDTHLGEYLVLRNTSGARLWLGELGLDNGSLVWQFGQNDTLEPNGLIIVAYGESSDQAAMLAADNLPAGLAAEPSLTWYWQTTMSLPDLEGSLSLVIRRSGETVGLIDQMYWSEDAAAPNAYCDAQCQSDPNREAVQSMQLQDLIINEDQLYDPANWAAAEATALGKDGPTEYLQSATALRSVNGKEYELKDHLGNIRLVVTDHKMSNLNGQSLPEAFQAEVLVMRDYYPFGMEMPGQVYVGAAYRYGFNGMERDDDVKGAGDHISFADFGFDARLGRRWNLDPFASKYPFQSPYSGFNCDPILYRDPSGMSGEASINRETKTITVTSVYGFYGGASTPELAKQYAANIESAFNQANGTIEIDGVDYRVQFKISGVDLSQIGGSYNEVAVKNHIEKNSDIRFNYVRLEETSNLIVSYTDDYSAPDALNGRGSNSGYWSTSQILRNGTTTEPHEYNHGLGGLDHPEDIDPNGGELDGEPTIDMTVNSYNYVMPKFWIENENCKIYVDVTRRMVSKENVSHLFSHNTIQELNATGTANIGKLSNVYHKK